jgi:uncharacterized repeat protein (TIGR01451 family)
VLKGTAQSCVSAIAPGTPGPVPGVPPATGLAPTLRVASAGPPRAAVGDPALFTITVTNAGQAPATNVKIAAGADVVMRANRASDDHNKIGSDLVWMIASLPPGQSVERRIEYVCEASAPRACSRVTVTCDEGQRADTEACLEIAGPAQPLSLTVANLTNPVVLGNEVRYDIRVTNFSAQPDRNVVLVVNLPNELSPIPQATSGPPGLRFNVLGQTIQFFPVAEIRPGETVSFRVVAVARQPGEVRPQASVTSANTPTPVTAGTSTTILAQ